MRIFYVTGAILVFVSQFLGQAYAVELCEPQDYYRLANYAKCKIKRSRADEKYDPRELMFEILKSYPYEAKEGFIKVLQRKIALVDSYIKRQQDKKQTEKSKENISKFEETKRALSEQLEMVKSATPDNWVSIRDQARIVLEESARNLREVE